MNDKPLRLAICCTDKGQHPWISLGALYLDQLLRPNLGQTFTEIAERRKDECVWMDHLDPGLPEYRVHMRCPRCRREVQWKHERAIEVMTSFHNAGISQLDISLV